jgi:two-component system, OmpR family, sensor histidine kinase BaeS
MADRRLRSSLLVRLLAVSVVVTVLSIAGTAWLAARTTTRAIQEEQGRALTDDAKIYDALLGYAAAHHDWTGVGPLVESLAASTGRRIVVTDRNRGVLAESGAGELSQRASATVDPLNVDENLAGSASVDRIDPRAVGPFTLPAPERADLRTIAGAAVTCLHQRTPTAVPDTAVRPISGDAEIIEEPSGRPRIAGDHSSPDTACRSILDLLARPTETERRALRQLEDLVNACLTRQQLPAVQVALNAAWVGPPASSVDPGYRAAVGACLTSGRREQLADYVAPAALLFVTVPGAPAAAAGFDLSPANWARIFGVTGVVLLAAIGVTVLVGVRLVGPLHALTAAAVRMRAGDLGARVRITGRNEIARLGAAFNDMSEHRQRVEALRRAMVGDIAHEMRTPVTNIRGWLEATEDGVVPLDKELVTSLLEEAIVLQHVIDDLQDMAAADAGELRLHRQPVHLPELLHAVAEAFGPAAEKAGVTLAVRAEPTTLTADPIRLRQAVGNLVTNAIRHTPAGGRIALSARTEGREIAIDVADTGPGIPAAQQALVFERFWRAEKSRNRTTGGSGLGLPIVRKLAEAHDGTATVTSTPGEGATFTLRLPLEYRG